MGEPTLPSSESLTETAILLLELDHPELGRAMIASSRTGAVIPAELGGLAAGSALMHRTMQGDYVLENMVQSTLRERLGESGEQTDRAMAIAEQKYGVEVMGQLALIVKDNPHARIPEELAALVADLGQIPGHKYQQVYHLVYAIEDGEGGTAGYAVPVMARNRLVVKYLRQG